MVPRRRSPVAPRARVVSPVVPREKGVAPVVAGEKGAALAVPLEKVEPRSPFSKSGVLSELDILKILEISRRNGLRDKNC